MADTLERHETHRLIASGKVEGTRVWTSVGTGRVLIGFTELIIIPKMKLAGVPNGAYRDPG